MDSRVTAYFQDASQHDFHDAFYTKGEIITFPQSRINRLMFVLSGQIAVYAVNENGDVLPVVAGTNFTVLGDIEFATGSQSVFFVEARSDVHITYLDIEKERNRLENDPVFLRALMKEIALKLSGPLMQVSINAPIRERVLVLLSRDSEIRGLENACTHLHCSRRQLIRVLHQLCDQGLVEHSGHGLYTLKKKGNQS
ncbi:MAG: Crp/Fnr family transcriptional regulator [Bulleidia sp.]